MVILVSAACEMLLATCGGGGQVILVSAACEMAEAIGRGAGGGCVDGHIGVGHMWDGVS